MSQRAVVALGSNLGDRQAALQGAVDSLDRIPGTRVVAVSGVYATDPVGGPEQGEFLNAVALVDTDRTPEELLAACQAIESEWHRVREVQWGPRTLDVDIISFDDVLSDDPRLTLPHPRAAERAFVCVPWLDVDPQAVIPGVGALRDVAARLDAAGVRPWGDLLLPGRQR